MRSQIRQIKVLSNTVAVQINDSPEFVTFLQSHIKKHFSTTLFLKHSMLIFAKENEVLKRKAFLTWLGSIFDRNLSLGVSQVTPELLKNLHLPINLQIRANTAVETSMQVFVVCNKSNIYFRHYVKNSPFFAFIKTYLRFLSPNERPFEVSVDLQNKSPEQIDTIKKLFLKRIFLTGKHFVLTYNKRELERFFDEIERSIEPQTSSIEVELANLLTEFGCNKNETMGAIKKRYFELAKLYHPDMAFGKDEQTVKVYAQKFIRIKSVYESICQLYAEQGKLAA